MVRPLGILPILALCFFIQNANAWFEPTYRAISALVAKQQQRHRWMMGMPFRKPKFTINDRNAIIQSLEMFAVKLRNGPEEVAQQIWEAMDQQIFRQNYEFHGSVRKPKKFLNPKKLEMLLGDELRRHGREVAQQLLAPVFATFDAQLAKMGNKAQFELKKIFFNDLNSLLADIIGEEQGTRSL